MNAKHLYWLVAVIAALLFGLAACSPEPEAEVVLVGESRLVTETVVNEAEAVAITTEIVPESAATVEPNTQLQPQARLIIKNGELTIIVIDTETAVSHATQLVADLGGYIINQQIVDSQFGLRSATMKLAVPVTQFEAALTQLRTLGDVTNDYAGGEDVTSEYVDLGSRLDNLIATRDRLRTFLDQAENVQEALRVNNELKTVEEEIALIQGRRNYLSNRAAFSTIDLTLQPLLPTATPSPIPTVSSWQPGTTAQVAAVRLQDSAQKTADFSLYYSIVCGPWLLLLGVLSWLGYRLRRRFLPNR